MNSSSYAVSIFISYSHTDRFAAEKIAEDLKRIGYNPWVDFEGIEGGTDWRKSIDDALQQSIACLVLLTPEATKSQYVKMEISRAKDLGCRLVPLMIRTAELPSELESTQYIDFRQDTRGALENLQKALISALARTAITKQQIKDEMRNNSSPMKPMDGLAASEINMHADTSTWNSRQPNTFFVESATQFQGAAQDVKANLVIIEDDLIWEEIIRGKIESIVSAEFQATFHIHDSMEWYKHIHQFTGPLIILMDLALSKSSGVTGLKWLMDEFEILRMRPQTGVFVISGYLNELVIQTLEFLGMPLSHICSKMRWPEESDTLAMNILKTLRFMSHMENPIISMVDIYLKQSFSEMVRDDTNITSSNLLPMVVRTRDKNWDYRNIPDLRVLAHGSRLFPCLGSLESLRAMHHNPDVIGVEASRMFGIQSSDDAFTFIKTPESRDTYHEEGDNCIVAIIDTWIDICHEAFLDENGKTRILAIWDQTAPPQSNPIPYISTSERIGAVFLKDEIQAFIENPSIMPSHLTLNTTSHGTHVASIAAGRKAGNCPSGIAPKAKLVFIFASTSKLKTDKGIIQGLGYSVSHMIALDFIYGLAKDFKLPVVINISQGLNMGAHDGSSALEEKIETITSSGREPGYVVVTSVGNNRHNNGHAKLLLISNVTDYLNWDIDNNYIGWCEFQLWFKSEDQLQFRLHDLFGNISDFVTGAQPTTKGVFQTASYEMELIYNHHNNGDALLHVFIDVNNTIDETKPNSWKLEVQCIKVASQDGVAHAWLERYGPTIPSRFTSHVDQEMTLKIPATSNNIIAVGAIDYKDHISVAPFSSYGPTRDQREYQKPDLAAPGVNILAAQSGTSNQAVNVSGTSMAAPQVTGAIALAFSRREKQITSRKRRIQFNSLQIAQALRKTTQTKGNTPNVWNRGIGFGILNVLDFMDDLENIL